MLLNNLFNELLCKNYENKLWNWQIFEWSLELSDQRISTESWLLFVWFISGIVSDMSLMVCWGMFDLKESWIKKLKTRYPDLIDPNILFSQWIHEWTWFLSLCAVDEVQNEAGVLISGNMMRLQSSGLVDSLMCVCSRKVTCPDSTLQLSVQSWGRGWHEEENVQTGGLHGSRFKQHSWNPQQLLSAVFRYDHQQETRASLWIWNFLNVL